MNIAKPQLYQVGDIIEVSVSFVAVTMENGMRSMRGVLRSIALLNATASKVRHVADFDNFANGWLAGSENKKTK
jgi:hypothetical protein